MSSQPVDAQPAKEVYTPEGLIRAAALRYSSVPEEFDTLDTATRERIQDATRRILDAVAPAIAARALRDAAGDLDRQAENNAEGMTFYHSANSLRGLADEIEGKVK